MSRSYIPPFTYMDVLVSSGSVVAQPNIQVGAAQGGSIMLGPDAVDGFAMQVWWNQLAADTQTLAGTLKVEASNDPRAFSEHDEHASAQWFDLTSQVTLVNPTTGAGDDLIQVSDVRFEFLRMSISSLSGSGRFKAVFSAHGT